MPSRRNTACKHLDSEPAQLATLNLAIHQRRLICGQTSSLSLLGIHHLFAIWTFIFFSTHSPLRHSVLLFLSPGSVSEVLYSAALRSLATRCCVTGQSSLLLSRLEEIQYIPCGSSSWASLMGLDLVKVQATNALYRTVPV